MAKDTIKIEMEAPEKDAGHLSLSDFSAGVAALTSILRWHGRNKRRAVRGDIDFRIVAATHNSPLQMEVRAIVPRDYDGTIGAAIMADSFKSFTELQNEKTIPDYLDRDILSYFIKLSNPLQKSRIKRITFRYDDGAINLSTGIKKRIEAVLSKDVIEDGEVAGRLEQFNIHSNKREFRIYPLVGHEVVCVFQKDQIERAKEGIDRKVGVRGRVYYKARDNYPYKIVVDELEVFRPNSELPTLMSLRGIAPNATGGISSEEFVRRLRDG